MTQRIAPRPSRPKKERACASPCLKRRGFQARRSVNTHAAIDDYGLSLARLVATPLLSGLAGIGGVIITLVLSDALTSASSITFENLFRFDLNYLLTAAAFGLAPNLIISGLQQKTAKYVSDLQKSKGGSRARQES